MESWKLGCNFFWQPSITVIARLVDTVADKQVWSETYERNLGDILNLQSEVVRSIANQIQLQLTREGIRTRLARARQANPTPIEPI